MSDYIEREAVLQRLESCVGWSRPSESAYEDIQPCPPPMSCRWCMENGRCSTTAPVRACTVLCATRKYTRSSMPTRDLKPSTAGTIGLENNIFPSLKPGEFVKLTDIIGGNT